MTKQWPSTIDLIRRIQCGDPGARSALIARYWDRVAVIASARLGLRLRRDLETVDVLQETFANLGRDLAGFEMRDEAALVRFLAKIVQRRILDAVKRQGADRRRAGADAASLDRGECEGSGTGAAELPHPQTDIVDRLARDEARARLVAALGALPESQRELILCRDYEGLAWEEVAQRTGRPSADAARVAHTKALAELGCRLGRRDG